MIRINAAYTDYFDNTDPAYPGGKAVDTTSGESEDGTPYKAVWMNTVNGFFQAAIFDALGSFTVSGNPDRVGDSDILNALKLIMTNRAGALVTAEYILAKLLTIDGIGSGLDADLFGGKPPEYYLTASSAGYFIQEISGAESVIPWSAFGITYHPEIKLIIFISAHGGAYKEFVSFPHDVQPDGLHVYPQKFIGGKLVGGTRMRKWGEGKWGEGMVYIPGRKWGVGKWGDGKWGAAAKVIGGTKWGDSAPMKINIQIKEA